MAQVLDELDVPAPVDPLPSDVPEGQDLTSDDRQPIPWEAGCLRHILGVPGHVLVAEAGLPEVRVVVWPREKLRCIWRKNGSPARWSRACLAMPSNWYASAMGSASSAIRLANASSPVRAATSARRIFARSCHSMFPDSS